MDKKLIENFVILLVGENIIPEYYGRVLRVKDSFRERQVVFCSSYDMGFNVNDGIVSIVGGYIEINFSKVLTVHSKPQKSKDVITAFIFNKKHEVLCQAGADFYFSEDCQEAICMYKPIADELMKRQEYKDCIVVELKIEPEKKEELLPIIDFMIQTGNVHQPLHK